MRDGLRARPAGEVGIRQQPVAFPLVVGLAHEHHVVPPVTPTLRARDHMVDGVTKGKADAVLAASIFHFGEIPIPELKDYLKQQNIPIR